jgi:hypothetical protein
VTPGSRGNASGKGVTGRKGVSREKSVGNQFPARKDNGPDTFHVSHTFHVSLVLLGAPRIVPAVPPVSARPDECLLRPLLFSSTTARGECHADEKNVSGPNRDGRRS